MFLKKRTQFRPAFTAIYKNHPQNEANNEPNKAIIELIFPRFYASTQPATSIMPFNLFTL